MRNSENKAKVSRRKNRYSVHRPTLPSPQQESVFLTMRQRALERDLNGKQKKATRYHLVALLILLLAIYGVGASSFQGGTFTTTLTVQVWQIVVIGAWFFLCVMVLSIFSDSVYFPSLLWMVVYWPLLAMVVTILFQGTTDFIGTEWIAIIFVIAEVLTFTITVAIHYLYPKMIRSHEFSSKHGRASKFYRIHSVAGWTMTYAFNHYWTKRCTCQYKGQFNDAGRPDGYGQWLDDSYTGEILSGQWKDGVPVAPFVSRLYGTGDAFRAMAISYFMATDDGFDSSRFIPTNTCPPRIGVATVECSIQGAFYKNLPHASDLLAAKEIVEEGGEGKALTECFHCMTNLSLGSSHDEQQDEQGTIHVSVGINPRGVEVVGHVYEPTGLPFSDEPDRIVIDVLKEKRDMKRLMVEESPFMPVSTRKSIRVENVLIRQDEPQEKTTKSGDDADDTDGTDVIITGKTATDDMESDRRSGGEFFARLHIRDWISTPHKEALVFLPGFNSCLSKSLKNLGQFMALTKVSDHVYPVIFAWPSGQIASYRQASAISATDRNKQLFLQFMRGLYAAGIRHVHFMSHSLGVQTLMVAFEDKLDGSRSDVSECFRLDHAFADDANTKYTNEALMVCKSITLVNPDFPVDAFVDHAFLSIRRVCNHITVVGDRSDQALFYSMLINGICNFLGYEQPRILNKSGKDEPVKKKRRFKYQRVVGRDIESLHLPDSTEEGETSSLNQDDVEKQLSMPDERLLFKGKSPAIILSDDDQPHEHPWLDIDVIDTTQLDTNIKDLRHSGFNVNPILLKDLEELIVTGRRAADRSTLLFREGNIYDYCHAPAFVTM